MVCTSVPAMVLIELTSIGHLPHHNTGLLTSFQALCKSKLAVAYEHSRPESRKMALLGHGNGFSFEASPYCSYAARDGVHVILAGEVSDWPGISVIAAAHDGECVQA